MPQTPTGWRIVSASTPRATSRALCLPCIVVRDRGGRLDHLNHPADFGGGIGRVLPSGDHAASDFVPVAPRASRRVKSIRPAIVLNAAPRRKSLAARTASSR